MEEDELFTGECVGCLSVKEDFLSALTPDDNRFPGQNPAPSKIPLQKKHIRDLVTNSINYQRIIKG